MVDGADEMAVRYYRDANFANRNRQCYTYTIFYKRFDTEDCGDLSDSRWCHPPFGKKLNDRISGVTIKAIWEGCPVNWEGL